MFPGEKSPGLIEALSPGRDLPRRTCFRGRNPPASLKLQVILAADRGRLAGRFRGRNPPASLKLDPIRHLAQQQPEFPGEKSPGLIEASSPSRPVPAARDVSGGEIPRPH